MVLLPPAAAAAVPDSGVDDARTTIPTGRGTILPVPGAADNDGGGVNDESS